MGNDINKRKNTSYFIAFIIVVAWAFAAYIGIYAESIGLPGEFITPSSSLIVSMVSELFSNGAIVISIFAYLTVYWLEDILPKIVSIPILVLIFLLFVVGGATQGRKKAERDIATSSCELRNECIKFTLVDGSPIYSSNDCYQGGPCEKSLFENESTIIGKVLYRTSDTTVLAVNGDVRVYNHP